MRHGRAFRWDCSSTRRICEGEAGGAACWQLWYQAMSDVPLCALNAGWMASLHLYTLLRSKISYSCQRWMPTVSRSLLLRMKLTASSALLEPLDNRRVWHCQRAISSTWASRVLEAYGRWSTLLDLCELLQAGLRMVASLSRVRYVITMRAVDPHPKAHPHWVLMSLCS